MDKENLSLTPAEPGATGESEKEDQARGIPADETPAGGLGAAIQELPADLVAAYEGLRAEKDALFDRLLRKQAELENLRKRMQREKEDFLQHATADLVRALLPTLDGFERALKHRNTDVPEQFYQGIELIFRDLLEVLKRAGLSAVETVGKTFDPHLHQAVETVPASGYRDQEIVEELQRGYKLKHRLLRPAIVKVAVGEQAPGAEAQAGPSAQSAGLEAKGPGTQ